MQAKEDYPDREVYWQNLLEESMSDTTVSYAGTLENEYSGL